MAGSPEADGAHTVGAKWQIAAFALMFITIALVQLQITDAGFRAAVALNAPAAIVRGLVRIPWVYARVLADHPAAIPITLSALALLSFAWWVSLGSRREWAVPIIERGVVVFLVVAAAWFFSFGKSDWQGKLEWGQSWDYYSTLKAAVESHRLPLYSRISVTDQTPGQNTERYLANAETLAGPQALLLSVLSIRDFFLVHVVGVAALGGLGLVALRRELDMAPFGWTVFAFVCYLNGHVTARLNAGNTGWVHLWLLPLVFLGVVRLRRGDVSARNVAALALVMATMIIDGAWHIFVWSWLFVFFACLRSRASVGFLLRLCLLVGGLGAFRVLPVYVTFGGGQNEFMAGFSSVHDVLLSLTGGAPAGVNGERNYFIGWAGVALAGVGLVPTMRGPSRKEDALWVPSVALLVLSMGNLYERTFFQLPGLVSERIALRFLSVAALGLVLIGCRQIQRWPFWGRDRLTAGALLMLPVTLLSVTQLVLSAEALRPRFSALPPPAFDNLKTTLAEAPYVWSVRIGLTLSLVSLLVALSAFRAPRGGRQLRRT